MAKLLGNLYDRLHNNGTLILGDSNEYTQHIIS